MDLDTAGSLVTALVSVYDSGLEYYTKWQRRQWLNNHYETQVKGKSSGGGSCGLSTSFSISGRQIREKFELGAEILGDGYTVGDDRCRGVLAANLEQLQARIDVLRGAMKSGGIPLELFEIIRLSESVRISSLSALSDQYQRFAVGRLVPQVIPTPNERSLPVEAPAADVALTPVDADDDVQTAYNTASSTKSPFQSEPPSPPPTPPKIIPDDLQSTCTSGSGFGPRPKASVFSLFCPEALKYQVDTRRAVPVRRNCKRCGYNWEGKHTEDKLALLVKDGFQLTARFLGKSHREGGFGCVLCTSSGGTEVGTFETVESLRDHINATHDKWQILHDRDMTGR